MAIDKLYIPGKPVPSEIINVADMLAQTNPNTEQILREMGDQCIRDFDNDDLSRSRWRDGVARAIKLFSNFMDVKTDPWSGASNINLPMLAIACLQFQARAFDALIPAKGVVNAWPTSSEDVNKAERVQKFMNYDLLYRMEDFEEGMDKSLLQVAIEGCIFRKTYYDPIIKRNVSCYISAQDMVVPYTWKGSIDECHRKSHILWKTKNEIRILAKKGMYVRSAFDLPAGSLAPDPGVVREAGDKVQGADNTAEWYDQPRKLIEMHRGWDIDGDGIEEPFVITVDYETRQVLRITDRRYYDWRGDVHTIEYFTKYGLLPNPEGFYDLGFGILITGLNEAGNSIINEVVDAGHLANVQGGFISRRSGIKRGKLSFKRGEFQEIDTYVDDLKKAIFTFDFKGPNQTLYAVLGLIYEYSKLVSSISETMTGQLPASDTPATTVMALIEEGRKVFSTIHKRLHRSFKRELGKLFRLNSIFLDEDTYYLVLGDAALPKRDPATGQPIMEKIGKSDFSNSIDVIPVSDPNIISRAEKVLKAQQAYQLTLASPLTSSNTGAIYAAQKALYEALEIPGIDALLQPPGPPPDLPPEEENAEMMTEKPAHALQQQDHMHHVGVHDEFSNGTYSDQMSPASKKLLEAHRREHIAMQYRLDAAAAQQNAMAMQAMATAGRI